MLFFAVVCIAWVFSVCVHEFAHAAVAYRGGDRSVAGKGYLTMNPLKYAHPVYSLAMPVLFLAMGGIGLPGGAVYIRDDFLRSRRWKVAVSLAGPAASAVLMLVLASPFLLGVWGPGTRSVQACCVAFLAGIQASAVVLNLLPIPPLDGFRAISPYLSHDLNRRLREAGAVPMLLLFMALWYVDPVAGVFWKTVFGILDVLRVPPELFVEGFRQFRFWSAPS